MKKTLWLFALLSAGLLVAGCANNAMPEAEEETTEVEVMMEEEVVAEEEVAAEEDAVVEVEADVEAVDASTGSTEEDEAMAN